MADRSDKASSKTSSKAIILLSGGLDSATVLAQAQHDCQLCYALSLDYGQRHTAELSAAKHIAREAGVVEHRILHLDLTGISHSSLTDPQIAVPVEPTSGIPSTYVPARNTIFLSLALAWAESLQCSVIYIGVNAVDYSGYPDCRPEFIQAFQAMAELATRDGVEGRGCRISAPLINLSKADIVRIGSELGVDYSLTVSCYQADAQGRACGQCDACRFRAQGFADAGIADPTRYQST